MELYDRLGSEQHPLYIRVAELNYDRYFSFLQTMIEAAVALPPAEIWLSHDLVKAINMHAIAGLHKEAGQYRSVPVEVGGLIPPMPDDVVPLMNDFVDSINTNWQSTDALTLATYALWRINYIHPFRNGNGRTARAVCYYILCVKSGGLLPGRTNLIELLRAHRAEYVDALREADNGDFTPLFLLNARLIRRQVDE